MGTTLYDLGKCPKCGSTEGFYTKYNYKGSGIYKYEFDPNEEADNSEMYQGLGSTRLKNAYCLECNKVIADADTFEVIGSVKV